jgi:DNA-binding NarL/FixJ family response regulator
VDSRIILFAFGLTELGKRKQTMPPVRVLLVDDNAEFLKSAMHLLALQPLLQVVGSATSGMEALDQSALLRPDLILMDWAMPGMNGLEAMHLIQARPNAPRVVMLTLLDLPQYRAAAMAAGADGFLAKSEWSVKLMPEVHRLFARTADSQHESNCKSVEIGNA